MQAIEQRQLILRKNLVGCDDIIFFEHYVLKLMGLNGTILTLGGWDSSFWFSLRWYHGDKIAKFLKTYSILGL